MEKTSLNYTNLFGYQKSLGLKGQQFSYLSASMLWLIHDPSPSTTPFHGTNSDTLGQLFMQATSSVNILAVGSSEDFPRRRSWPSASFAGE